MQFKILTQAELALMLPSQGAESVDSIAVTAIDSKATLTMRCSAETLPSLLYTLIGDSGTGYAPASPNFGKLDRLPPAGHPYFPWLYCTGVSEVRGQAYTGAKMFTNRNENGGLVNSTSLQQTTYPFWPMYREYVVKAEFSQREYPVANDAAITQAWGGNLFRADYYAERNTTKIPDVAQIPMWNEWTRFCVLSYEIEGQFLTAEQGQYEMISTTAMNGVSAGKGNVRQLRSGAKVTYTWFGVPYEWLTGPADNGFIPRGFSILDLAQGHVNQQEFDGWSAGTLLYTGAKTIRVYNRTFPKILSDNTMAPRRLCDIALECVYRDPRRRKEDKINLKSYGSLITRGNNLVPNARDGYWYSAQYVGADKTALVHKENGAVGIYPSMPFQFLFQDPAYMYRKIGGFLV